MTYNNVIFSYHVQIISLVTAFSSVTVVSTWIYKQYLLITVLLNLIRRNNKIFRDN